MSLILRISAVQQLETYAQSTLSQAQKSATVASAETALEAYRQGLLDVRYCKDGWIQTIKGPGDIPPLLRNGFTLQQVDGKFYLTRGLLGGNPLDELIRKLQDKPSEQKSVFISYQWDNTDIVNEIQTEFENNGMLVIRDVDNLSTGVNLREFMQLIKHPNLDYVIVILSDK